MAEFSRQWQLQPTKLVEQRADILILDEATSALDIDTENSILSSIEDISRSVTIIMIAHRLDTIKRCNRVIRLSQGRIIAEGDPLNVLNDLR